MVAYRSIASTNPLIPLLDSQGLQRADKDSQRKGVLPEQLMEAAGLGIAHWITNFFLGLRGFSYSSGVVEDLPILILVGTGNNGADGFVVSRYLVNAGFHVQVLKVFPRSKGLNEFQNKLALEHRVAILEIGSDEAFSALQNASVVVDCIFGTGVRRTSPDTTAHNTDSTGEVLKQLFLSLSPRAPEVPIAIPFNGTLRISVDYPTESIIFTPHFTLMLGAANYDLYEPAVRPFAGFLMPLIVPFSPAVLETCQKGWLVNWAGSRDPGAKDLRLLNDAFQYKKSRGSFGVIGGSLEYPRAPWLTLHSGIKTGVGLVYTDDNTLGQFEGASSLIPIPTTDKEKFEVFLGLTPPKVLVVGPGWSTQGDFVNSSLLYASILQKIFEIFLDPNKTDHKVLLDAGALRTLGSHSELQEYLMANPKRAERVLLTPHLGELKDFVPHCTLVGARDLVDRLGVGVLVKYSSMVFLSPKNRLFVWDFPNPIMGFGGSGDILAGLIGGLGARWSNESWETILRTAVPLYLSVGKELHEVEGFVDGEGFIPYLGKALLCRSLKI